ncbi:MAG: DnaJ-like cysteine-rich domain-containing protein [Flavobacteriales bacterium]
MACTSITAQPCLSTCLQPVEKRGKWGYIPCANAKKPTIAPQFDYAGPFKDERCAAVVGMKCGGGGEGCMKYAFIRDNGELLTGFDYDGIELVEGWYRNDMVTSDIEKAKRQRLGIHLARTKRDGKYGVFNMRTGKEALPPIADEVMSYSGWYSWQSLIVYKRDGKYGAVDHDGRQLVEAEYDLIHPARDGDYMRISYNYLLTRKDGKTGLVFGHGGVVPARFDSLFGYDRIAMRRGDYGKLARHGHDIDRWVVTMLDGKYGLFDRHGNELIACELNAPIEYPDHGIIQRGPEGLWGVTDFYGREVVPYEYDTVISYLNGPADCAFYAVRKLGKWGAIREDGEELLPAIYDTMVDGCMWNMIFTKTRDHNIGIMPGCEVGWNTDMLFVFNRCLEFDRKRREEWERYLRKEEQFWEQVRKPPGSKLAPCDCCRGTGTKTDHGVAKYKTCPTCGGKGTHGYVYHSPTSHQDQVRWYGGPGWGQRTCPSCKGSGKVFDDFGNKNCACCGGKGVR